MASVNKAILVGRLGADPEVTQTSTGTPVCNLSVATNENWTDKSGQKQERTEWHRVVVFGRQAENCGRYLEKGRQVYLEGRIQTRKWQDRDNNTKYTTEIVAQIVQFLSGGSSGGGGGGYDSPPPPDDDFAGGTGGGFDDDEIPF